MKISVIGVGYLGAVHAASMADLGHTVVGLDVDAERIERLNRGRTPFYEPGFEDLLERGLDAGLLSFTTDYADIADADVHFLGLGTPQQAGSDSADLTYIHAAITSLMEVLPQREGRETLIAGKSTVPVGTARELADRVEEIPGVILAWNPEFLREGLAVKDTLRPDRLVYGVRDAVAAEHGDSDSARAVEILDEVYADLLAHKVPRKVYSFETSELVKVSANAFLATKISFINAIAEICEASGADVTHVAEAIGFDDRIGKKFLRAGVGFGGGCLPKDIRGFMARAEELGTGRSLAFLREIDAINLRRRKRPVQLAREHFEADGGLDGKRITILGAAFKPKSDDIRDSPALDIADSLVAEGAVVTVTDPAALHLVNERRPHITTEIDHKKAMRGAQLVILATEWKRFKRLDPAETHALVDSPVIIDGRGVLDPVAWRGAGWTIHALGRP